MQARWGPQKKKKVPVGQKMKTKKMELAEMLTKSSGMKEKQKDFN